METQSPQLHVALQVVTGHRSDVVEGEIQSKRTACYHGNMGKSTTGAVAGELQVAAIAGRPLGVRV